MDSSSDPVEHLSSREVELLKAFRATYPGYVVRVTPIFVGPTAEGQSPQVARCAARVVNRANNQTVRVPHADIEWTLRYAEMQIVGTYQSGDQQHYDRELITSFLPDALRAAGWRCSRAWYEPVGEARTPKYWIRLRRDGAAAIELSDYNFRDIFEWAVDETERSENSR